MNKKLTASGIVTACLTVWAFMGPVYGVDAPVWPTPEQIFQGIGVPTVDELRWRRWSSPDGLVAIVASQKKITITWGMAVGNLETHSIEALCAARDKVGKAAENIIPEWPGVGLSVISVLAVLKDGDKAELWYGGWHIILRRDKTLSSARFVASGASPYVSPTAVP